MQDQEFYDKFKRNVFPYMRQIKMTLYYDIYETKKKFKKPQIQTDEDKAYNNLRQRLQYIKSPEGTKQYQFMEDCNFQEEEYLQLSDSGQYNFVDFVLDIIKNHYDNDEDIEEIVDSEYEYYIIAHLYFDKGQKPFVCGDEVLYMKNDEIDC